MTLQSVNSQKAPTLTTITSSTTSAIGSTQTSPVTDSSILPKSCSTYTSRITRLILLKQPPTKQEEIAALFASKHPKDILPLLHHKGYRSIGECHCISEFSREKNIPISNPDCRAITERKLPKLIKKKFPIDKPLKICSIACGGLFFELGLLYRIYNKGYDISLTLVSPYLFCEKGQQTLAEFRELVKYICPSVKITLLDTIEQIKRTNLIADVFVLFDDDDLGCDEFDDYLKLRDSFESYLDSLLSHPIIYLFGGKKHLLDSFKFSKKDNCIEQTVDVLVTLKYFPAFDSSDPQIARTLVDYSRPNPIHIQGTPCPNLYKLILDSNDYDAVKFCLEKGADANFKPHCGNTAVMMATVKNHLNTLKALIEVGHAKINEPGAFKFSALHLATASHVSQDIFNYLIDHGADINAQDEGNSTPLHFAVRRSNTAAIRILVERGAKLDMKDEEGRTPLQLFDHIIKEDPEKCTDDTAREIRALLQPKK